MNLNPRPKSEFVKDARAIESHHVLAQNEVLRRNLQLAYLEMSRRLTENPPADMGGCAASYLRLLGAQEFLHEFYNLAEQSVPTTKSDSTNLTGNIPTKK